MNEKGDEMDVADASMRENWVDIQIGVRGWNHKGQAAFADFKAQKQN